MRPIALLIVAGFAVAGVSVAGCGSDDSVSQAELQEAVDEATAEAETQDTIDELQGKIKKIRKNSGAAPAPQSSGSAPVSGGSGLPGDADSCGSGIYAKAGTTSCAFALNVGADYLSGAGNSFTSYSPTTDEAYSITCSGGNPTVCRGGNGAEVYIP